MILGPNMGIKVQNAIYQGLASPLYDGSEDFFSVKDSTNSVTEHTLDLRSKISGVEKSRYVLDGDTNNWSITARAAGDDGATYLWQWGIGSGNNTTFEVVKNTGSDSDGYRFRPGEFDGVTPFYLNTWIPHTTGNLVEFANDSTNWFQFGISGNASAITLHGIVGEPARIISEDSFDFITADGGGGVWQLSTFGFHPQSDGLASIGQVNSRLQNVYTGEITWGGTGDPDNNKFDALAAGAPEGVVNAAPGSVWRNSNGGAGTTLFVKESGTGNTGWTAIGGGGGGDTLWTTNSIISNAINPVNTNNIVQIEGVNGGYYVGTAQAISNNFVTPSFGDVLMAEANGDFGGAPTSLRIDFQNVMDVNYSSSGAFDVLVETNSSTININANTGGGNVQAFLATDGVTASLSLDNGTVSTDSGTTKWNFKGSQSGSGLTLDTSNYVIIVINGVTNKLALVQ